MWQIFIQLKESILNLLFPSFCLNCQKEGDYFCQDCLSLINISNYQYCPFCYPPKIVLDGKTCYFCKKREKKLDGLFSAASYKNFIIKKLISQFKYQPYYIKNLSKVLASLIITHFQLLENPPPFFGGGQAILIPIPLEKKKLKQRGFNQAEEVACQLSNFFKIPLVNNVLIKIKGTLPQVELSGEAREKNILGAFACQETKDIKGKKILLVDDVFTTGATMEESARVLKKVGAKEVWGVVVARG